MSGRSPDLRIPLPQNRVLRVLALYGIAAGVILLSIPILLHGLALPAWVGTVAVLVVLILAPVAALVARLTQPRA
jgi:hypothetical protein